MNKIFERVMSGTKGAAKAVQGACNILVMMTYTRQWSTLMMNITCRQIQGVQEVDEIAIS